MFSKFIEPFGYNNVYSFTVDWTVSNQLRCSTVFRYATAIAATLTLMCGVPAVAQTSHETKVDHDTSVKNGVATTKTKVTETTKRKIRQPKKVLGVKVGHKTVKRQTVRETEVSSDGDRKTTVTTK